MASKQGACFVNRERTLKQICGMLLSGGTCSARHSKRGIRRSLEVKTAAKPGLLVRRFCNKKRWHTIQKMHLTQKRLRNTLSIEAPEVMLAHFGGM